MQRLLPRSYRQQFGHATRIELAAERRMRTKNTRVYRVLHWPLWMWVFFLVPGPLTFDLFAKGADRRIWLWFAAVVAGTGYAAWRGWMPGTEPRPYILRFGDDMPNPLYRRLCYTFAWGDILSFAVLNLAGLIDAVIHGGWRLRHLYDVWYLPVAAVCWLAGAAGWLPRAGRSTKSEGIERRYFYGSVWAVCLAQPVLMILWRVLPPSHQSDLIKLFAFAGILVLVGNLARLGHLPRTRPIVSGEIAIAD